MDPTTRFSDRVANYQKHRPGYPADILSLLARDCGLTRNSVVADIGSGTGLLTELFCRNGNRVYGVEPNRPMREAGEQYLAAFPNFTSVEGTAEATTLDGSSVDIATAGQAFHWFDIALARREFRRILKMNGWAVLVWNERRLHASPFLEAYENLLHQFGTDYKQVQQEYDVSDLPDFFGHSLYRTASFPNFQDFDQEGLRGRILSASYMPAEDDPNYAPMLREIERVFREHQREGRVRMEYDTRVYYGPIT